MNQQDATIEQLCFTVRNCPIIDNHAHNLLMPAHQGSYPFESITTEAQGVALRDTFKSLPHLRAQRQLRTLYECEPDVDWEAIQEKRKQWLEKPDALTRRCLKGTHCILMDDGLDNWQQVYSYEWHDEFTEGPCKRIVRIETVAERLMETMLREAREQDLDSEDYFADTWVNFTDDFTRAITDAMDDPEIAGFKSVVCYRTGLDVESDYNEALMRVGKPFEKYISRCIRKRKFRIDRKPFNDYLVLKTLEVLSERTERGRMAKPLQFHTGLGDNDMKLLESNPAYLQSVIENYPNVPFVLLHSAYPYTREAGYLATVFRHVYLDIGEVFPMISRDGQLSVLRQSLELVPGSKLLYSTDGHWFPETYWLANRQFREVLEEILVEYVSKGDLTTGQAIGFAKDILFNNSNELYRLENHLEIKDLGESTVKSMPLLNNSPHIEASRKMSAAPPPQQSQQQSQQPQGAYDVSILERFRNNYAKLKWVYVQWLDYMGTMRVRILPIAEFDRMVRSGGRISIARGNTGTLQNDHVTAAVDTAGSIYVEPDLRTLRRTHPKDPLPAATVIGAWRNEDGTPIKECPRSGLEILLNDLATTHHTTMTLGFEIEVTFLYRDPPMSEQPYAPITTAHAWATMTNEQWQQLPLMAEIADALADIGIPIQQFHAESAPGQYEFVLPPLPALIAIDTLIQARQVISQIAATHDLRATLHPMPLSGTGTAQHVHIGLITDTAPSQNGNGNAINNATDTDMHSSNSAEMTEMEFFAGVLEHLDSICAFTLPEASSYARVIDDSWTGGTWITWGTQNRETPLRRVQPGRWEVRCLDGFANMYLAISAIVGAGLLGVKERMEMHIKDTTTNPARLTDEQRAAYGITERMPRSLEESLEALDDDGELKEILAAGLVQDYVDMKHAEQKMLMGMEEPERHVWLVERY